MKEMSSSSARQLPQLVTVVETRPIPGASDWLAIVRRPGGAPLYDQPIVFGGVHKERLVPGSVVAAVFRGETWQRGERPLKVQTLRGQRSHGELGSPQEIGMLPSEGNLAVFLFPFDLHRKMLSASQREATSISRAAASGLIAQRIELINTHLLTDVLCAQLVAGRAVSPEHLFDDPVSRAASHLGDKANDLARALVHDCYRAMMLSDERYGAVSRGPFPSRVHAGFLPLPAELDSAAVALDAYIDKFYEFSRARELVGDETLKLLPGLFYGERQLQPASTGLSKIGNAQALRICEWLEAATAIGRVMGVEQSILAPGQDTSKSFMELARARLRTAWAELGSAARTAKPPLDEPIRMFEIGDAVGDVRSALTEATHVTYKSPSARLAELRAGDQTSKTRIARTRTRSDARTQPTDMSSVFVEVCIDEVKQLLVRHNAPFPVMRVIGADTGPPQLVPLTADEVAGMPAQQLALIQKQFYESVINSSSKLAGMTSSSSRDQLRSLSKRFADAVDSSLRALAEDAYGVDESTSTTSKVDPLAQYVHSAMSESFVHRRMRSMPDTLPPIPPVDGSELATVTSLDLVGIHGIEVVVEKTDFGPGSIEAPGGVLSVLDFATSDGRLSITHTRTIDFEAIFGYPRITIKLPNVNHLQISNAWDVRAAGLRTIAGRVPLGGSLVGSVERSAELTAGGCSTVLLAVGPHGTVEVTTDPKIGTKVGVIACSDATGLEVSSLIGQKVSETTGPGPIWETTERFTNDPTQREVLEGDTSLVKNLLLPEPYALAKVGIATGAGTVADVTSRYAHQSTKGLTNDLGRDLVGSTLS